MKQSNKGRIEVKFYTTFIYEKNQEDLVLVQSLTPTVVHTAYNFLRLIRTYIVNFILDPDVFGVNGSRINPSGFSGKK